VLILYWQFRLLVFSNSFTCVEFENCYESVNWFIVACHVSLLILNKRKLHKYVEKCHFSDDKYIVIVQGDYFIWLQSPVTSRQVATHEANHHLNPILLITKYQKFAYCVEFCSLCAEYSCFRKEVNSDKSSLICLV